MIKYKLLGASFGVLCYVAFKITVYYAAIMLGVDVPH